MDRLLCKPEEAAELLRIGRSKFYELLADGSSTQSESTPADAFVELKSTHLVRVRDAGVGGSPLDLPDIRQWAEERERRRDGGR